MRFSTGLTRRMIRIQNTLTRTFGVEIRFRLICSIRSLVMKGGLTVLADIFRNTSSLSPRTKLSVSCLKIKIV